MGRFLRVSAPGFGHLPPSTDVRGSVRIGAAGTVLGAIGVGFFSALPGLSPATRTVLWVVIALGLSWVALLWWVEHRRPTGMRRPWAWLLAWSLVDIVLISMAVAAAGGAHSELAFLYVLPVVFFTALFGPAEQVLLFWSGMAGYVGAAWLAGEPVAWPQTGLRIGTITAAAIVSSYLAGRLRVQAEQHRHAERLAERRAQLLAVAAMAGRTISRLDADAVLDALVRETAGLGLPAVALFMVDPGRETIRCAHQRGLPASWSGRRQSIELGLVGQVVRERCPRSVEDYRAYPHAIQEILELGFQTAIGLPILGDDGEVTAVLVVADRHARQISPEQVEALELVASIAGAALANARRFGAEAAARERLELLAQMQEDFVSTASHELRTPLTIVRGAAELLHRRWGDLDEEQRRDFVARINRHSHDLERLTDRLLQFRELESGDREPEPVQIALASTIAQVVERTGYRTRNHDVVWDVPRELNVLADLELLETALEALLDNAAQHTPAGTRIEITVQPSDDQVGITVTDHGPGMPPELVEAVQRRFGRGGDVLTRSTRGVGIGLTTVRRIARLHGSDLRLDTEAGRGTTVGFEVPRLPARAATPRQRLETSQVIRLRPPGTRPSVTGAGRVNTEDAGT